MSKSRPTWIPVVAGIIKKDGKVLMGLRPDKESQAGKWEFPGGKIESGETPEVALIRELEEEVGIVAEIGPLRHAVTHNYAEVGVVILFFEVNYWQGEPRTIYHQDHKWVDKETVDSLALPEANRLALSQLKAYF